MAGAEPGTGLTCVMADQRDLRRLTLGDVGLDALIARRPGALDTGAELNHVGQALVKLGALVASDGSDRAWQQTVAAALDAGVTPDEVVDALVVLAPVIGRTRVVTVAPKLALAVGFDVAAALEAR
jgi:alkylhydroperoxidase/carboxymuconolactone decarboxylase family protein YurZ